LFSFSGEDEKGIAVSSENEPLQFSEERPCRMGIKKVAKISIWGILNMFLSGGDFRPSMKEVGNGSQVKGRGHQ
jgi:hypothetical protein